MPTGACNRSCSFVAGLLSTHSCRLPDARARARRAGPLGRCVGNEWPAHQVTRCVRDLAWCTITSLPAYWSRGIRLATLQAAVAQSLCLPGFHSGALVAFARVIRLRHFCEPGRMVFVLPAHRARPLARDCCRRSWRTRNCRVCAASLLRPAMHTGCIRSSALRAGPARALHGTLRCARVRAPVIRRARTELPACL